MSTQLKSPAQSSSPVNCLFYGISLFDEQCKCEVKDEIQLGNDTTLVSAEIAQNSQESTIGVENADAENQVQSLDNSEVKLSEAAKEIRKALVKSANLLANQKVGPDGVLWVRLAKTGEYVHEQSGKFKVTPEHLQMMVRNFKPVTIDFDHNSKTAMLREKTPQAGVMVECEQSPRPPDKNGQVWLWGKAILTESAADMVNKGEYWKASPEIRFNAQTDQAKPIGTMLRSYALTNRPFWDDLTLSEDFPGKAQYVCLDMGDGMPMDSQTASTDNADANAPWSCEYDSEKNQFYVITDTGERKYFSIPEGFRVLPNDVPSEPETSSEDISEGNKEETTMPEKTAATVQASETAISDQNSVQLSGESTVVAALLKEETQSQTVTDIALSAVVTKFNDLFLTMENRLGTLIAKVESLETAQKEREVEHQRLSVSLTDLQNTELEGRIKSVFTDKHISPAFQDSLMRTAKDHGMDVMLSDLAKFGSLALVDTSEIGTVTADTVSLSEIAETELQKAKTSGMDYKTAQDHVRRNFPQAWEAYIA